MKSLKKLAPILLIALMVLSCFSLVNNTITTKKEYDGYMKQAEIAEKKTISVDVDEAYAAALDVDSNPKIYRKWASYYYNIKEYDTAKDICVKAQETFPKDGGIYVVLMKSYLALNNYEEFFNTYNKSVSLKIKNDDIKNLYNKNKYVYQIDYGTYSEVYPYSFGYARYAEYNDDAVSYGFTSSDNYINATYKAVGDFADGDTMIAPVVDQNDNAYFINADGDKKYVITPKDIQVKKLGVYGSGVFSIFDGSKYYLCNLDSKVIAGPFDYVSTINEKVGIAQSGNQYFIINEKGKKIGNDTYDGFILNTKEMAYNTCLFAKKGNVYYMLDAKGNKITNDTFEDAKLFKAEYAAVKKNGKWGFIDKKGEVVIDYQYDDAKSFYNGLAPVCINGYWGYIDTNAKVVIKCQFQDAYEFIAPSDSSYMKSFVKIGDTWRPIKTYK